MLWVALGVVSLVVVVDFLFPAKPLFATAARAESRRR